MNNNSIKDIIQSQPTGNSNHDELKKYYDDMIILKDIKNEERGITILMGLDNKEDMNPCIMIMDSHNSVASFSHFDWGLLLDIGISQLVGESKQIAYSKEEKPLTHQYFEENINIEGTVGSTNPVFMVDEIKNTVKELIDELETLNNDADEEEQIAH